MKTLLTLFSGGGLAECGAKAAGFIPVGAVECDPKISEVYAANHGDHVLVSRVEDVDYRRWSGVYTVWASPVCKNASVAKTDGKEAPEDLASATAIIRCLQECRPRAFVLENVMGYRAFESFQILLRGLRDLGYQARWAIENAANHGVPQTRKRLILRAVLNGRVPDLAATHCEGGSFSAGSESLFAEHDLLPWVGWYASIEDLIPSCPDSQFAAWQLKHLPKELTSCLVDGRDAGRWYGLRECAEPSPTISTRGEPKAFLVMTGNTSDAQAAPGVGVLSEDRPANTVAAMGGGTFPRAFLVDGKNVRGTGRGGDCSIRATGGARCDERGSAGFKPRALVEQGRVISLTPRCLARFQSVPDSYVLPERKALACLVIGNGVPILLAQAVLESLL